MNGKAKPDNHDWHYKSHECNRHKDLTILMAKAKKDICNHCFATLKKSYYNVMAGMLLEQQYIHNLSAGFVTQIQGMTKLLQQQERHLMNLSSEISEMKNNGRNHDTPTPEPAHQALGDPSADTPPETPPDTQEDDPKGHVAQATASLTNVLHDKVKRVLKKLRDAHEKNKF